MKLLKRFFIEFSQQQRIEFKMQRLCLPRLMDIHWIARLCGTEGSAIWAVCLLSQRAAWASYERLWFLMWCLKLILREFHSLKWVCCRWFCRVEAASSFWLWSLLWEWEKILIRLNQLRSVEWSSLTSSCIRYFRRITETLQRCWNNITKRCCCWNDDITIGLNIRSSTPWIADVLLKRRL